jgi:3-hydroxyacyl-CoA dehydrogenase
VKTRIRKAAVLGAGTMGAQVAAHLAGCGLDVVLLDVAASGSDRSAPARKGLEALRRLKPGPLHRIEDLSYIRPGNFEDDLGALAGADWVFEAVVEDAEIKRKLYARVAPALSATALLTTNTSGLSLAGLAEALPAARRRRFFGTHFFNPPRYLHLLETIPGPETDLALMGGLEAFAEAVLGKGVVRAKDTPNFIANRIGSYGFGVVLQAMMDLDLGIDDVDALTGPAIGRARSATFRTADIAGVDVCVKVAENLYQAVPHDPEREAFRVPAFMKTMLERGWLGEKAGGGFYRKDGKEIRVLDWKTLEYRDRRPSRFPSVEAASSVADPAARLRQILSGQDKGAALLSRALTSTALYAAALVPEIADDFTAIDRAMRWGYGWGVPPFRLLDALGPAAVAESARAAGRPVPPLVAERVASGGKTFYDDAAPAARPGVVDLPAVKAGGGLVKKNPGASLVDLGDGVALVEFHSKMNALGGDAIEMLGTAVREAAARFDALVVGNQGEQFSAGANLMLVLLAAQEEEWDELDSMVRRFQDANMALKYAEVPVVAAPFGLTLGGGCEIGLHAARVRASAETYMGLVEVGVGLLPGGGGTKEMALRAHARAAGVEGADPFPFLKRAFETIAFARVSTSGAEALAMFLTPADTLSMNPDRLLGDAKQVALGLARAGWRPPRPAEVPVLGRPGLAVFRAGIHNGERGGRVSEHDALIGTKLAAVLCGGDRAPGTASEQHFLDLEREAFLSLLGTRKTQERIQHMLKEGKPLRN